VSSMKSRVLLRDPRGVTFPACRECALDAVYFMAPNVFRKTCWLALFQKFCMRKPYSERFWLNGANMASAVGSFQSAGSSQARAKRGGTEREGLHG